MHFPACQSVELQERPVKRGLVLDTATTATASGLMQLNSRKPCDYLKCVRRKTKPANHQLPTDNVRTGLVPSAPPPACNSNNCSSSVKLDLDAKSLSSM